MEWDRLLAYIAGTVDQELLLRNEYLAAENRILRAQIKGRPLLSEAEKARLGNPSTAYPGPPFSSIIGTPGQPRRDRTRPHSDD
jgi:hypothetical protein